MTYEYISPGQQLVKNQHKFSRIDHEVFFYRFFCESLGKIGFNYSNRFRLDNVVTLYQFVWPICLPTTELKNDRMENYGANIGFISK